MSNFVDVTVTLQATFNTGNFGNVRPEVTLTRKNVDIASMADEYHDLLECAEAMFALQTNSLMNEVKTANGDVPRSITVYMRALEDNTDRMLQTIEDYQEKHK
jgi:predicted Zn-dependent protease with MMP-like domain